jgi:hypothetical protein
MPADDLRALVGTAAGVPPEPGAVSANVGATLAALAAPEPAADGLLDVFGPDSSPFDPLFP